MNKSMDLQRISHIMVTTAVTVVLFDLPFRMIELLGLIPAAGPKNMLPVLFGLLFGPAGVAGTAIGVLASGLIRWQLGLDCVFEILMTVLAGYAAYVVWYHLPVYSRPRCKNAREALCLLVCIVVSSILCAAVTVFVPISVWDGSAAACAAQMGISTAVWSLLLGVPCLITATSMFGMQPAAPVAWLAKHPDEERCDLERFVMNTPESIAEMSDAIDLLSAGCDLDPKQSYDTMSCVEELNCLILAQLPEGGTNHVRLTVGDSLVIQMLYGGKRYNPLAAHMRSGGPMANMDMLGILMVREMAVYAHYEYMHGLNEIRIIL